MDNPPLCACHSMPMWWRKDRQKWVCLIAKHDQSHLPSMITVTCVICGAVRRTLRGHTKPLHDMTTSQYEQVYGEDPIGANLRAYMREHHIDAFGGKYWTQERIIAAIRAFAKQRNRPPIAREWQRAGNIKTSAHQVRRSYPSTLTVFSTFGSWNAAIEAAGLTPRGVGGAGHRPRLRCKRGHDDWLNYSGRRRCRRCLSEYRKIWRQGRKAA